MLILKRALLALVTASALCLPAAVAPQPASAGCGLLLNIISLGVTAVTDACRPFDAVNPSCGITMVGATASNGGNTHAYDYGLTNPCGYAHVQAGYDVTTQQGKETIDSNGRRIVVLWSCSSDPWIAPPNPVPACTRLSASVTGDTNGVDVNQIASATYPLSAAGITSISNEALNGQLQNAINQLQANARTNPQPAPVAPTPQPPVCPQGYHDPQIADGWPLLDVCSQSEAVRTAWAFLIDRHYGVPDSYVRGKYGPETASVVLRFQHDNQLLETGTLDAQTWPALLVQVQEGDQKQSVGALLRLLAAQGVDVVAPVGDVPVFGPQLTSVVEAYQDSHGLVVDGVVGPETWQSLLSGA